MGKSSSTVGSFSNSRKLFLKFVLALGLVLAMPDFGHADDVSTAGSANGSAGGSSDVSTVATFGSRSDSQASSVGNNHDSGSSNSQVESGVVQQSSAGDNQIGVYSGSAASVKSGHRKATVSAGAETAGATNDLENQAQVNATARIDDNNYYAAATASNGSIATANGGHMISVFTFVPNGTTNYANVDGVTYSLSTAADGNYALAAASSISAKAAVGMNASVSLSTASISQMIQSVLYATANASFSGISASASASISGTASNLAARAHAAGFSQASARVVFNTSSNIATITLSSNARCADNSKSWNGRQIECRTFRKTIKLDGATRHMTMHQMKKMGMKRFRAAYTSTTSAMTLRKVRHVGMMVQASMHPGVKAKFHTVKMAKKLHKHRLHKRHKLYLMRHHYA
jgi:hypothetical protein